MSEITWIKILVDIFDDEAIELIEQMPDGDTLLIIWFKLLTKAGKINDGGLIYFKENIPYTEEMLSTIFKKPIATIRLALQTFIQFGLIEITDTNQILISNWKKHQNIDGMNKVREQGRKRVQKFREEKRKLLENKGDSECNVTCNVTVTQSNATDKEEDKEEEKELITSSSMPETENFEIECFGEMKDVVLPKGYYGKLLAITQSKELLAEVIDDFGVNIRTGKEEPYKESLPFAHFERLKAYIKQRKKSFRCEPVGKSPPVREEDIELLTKHFSDKENPSGYVRYLIQNNDHIVILEKLKKEQEQKQKQAQQTTTYAPSWKQEDFVPATEEEFNQIMSKDRIFKKEQA